MATGNDILRYRLLGCPNCGRNWMVDPDPLPAHESGCTELWLEVQTFFAKDNGPGLAPTPVLHGSA